MLIVMAMIYLCQTWIYGPDTLVTILEGTDAFNWHEWCSLELANFYSKMIGAMIFSLMRSFHAPTYEIKTSLIVFDNESADFLST